MEHQADAGPLRGQPVLRDALAPAAVVDVADRVAIDGDAALLEVLEQVDAAQEGGLAGAAGTDQGDHLALRSEEHTSELQSLMSTSYAVFCLNNKQQRS